MLRPLSPDEKAMRAARIGDWCARNRVETTPSPPEYERTPDEIRALGCGGRLMIYGRKKLQKADVARAKAARR